MTEHGVEVIVRVVEWAHTAPDDRASFLRGENYTPGGPGKYLAIANLLPAEKLPGRFELSAAWDEAGRPHFLSAAAETEPKADALEATIEALTTARGNPDATPDPELSRKVLRVWLDIGGGPSSLASVPLDRRAWAVRDVAARIRSEVAQRRAERAQGVAHGR